MPNGTVILSKDLMQQIEDINKESEDKYYYFDSIVNKDIGGVRIC